MISIDFSDAMPGHVFREMLPRRIGASDYRPGTALTPLVNWRYRAFPAVPYEMARRSMAVLQHQAEAGNAPSG